MRRNAVICLLGIFLSLGFAESALLAQSSQMVAGYFYEEGPVRYSDSSYRIFNTSPSQNVVLGPIRIMEKDGALGSFTVYSDLAGTIIPPLGYETFNLSDTGAPGSGTRIVIITWDGPVETTRIVGEKIFYDAMGSVVGVRDLELLGPQSGNSTR